MTMIDDKGREYVERWIDNAVRRGAFDGRGELVRIMRAHAGTEDVTLDTLVDAVGAFDGQRATWWMQQFASWIDINVNRSARRFERINDL